jgi:hypothetical protein
MSEVAGQVSFGLNQVPMRSKAFTSGAGEGVEDAGDSKRSENLRMAWYLSSMSQKGARHALP